MKKVTSLFTFNGKLLSQLGQFAKDTIGPLGTDPACGLALRAMILAGAERMETEGCVADRHLAIARSNLKRFINEMKVEAVFLAIQNGSTMIRSTLRKGILTSCSTLLLIHSSFGLSGRMNLSRVSMGATDAREPEGPGRSPVNFQDSARSPA